MSKKEKREYFSHYLSECKAMREQNEGEWEDMDEMIAWLEDYLAELEAEGSRTLGESAEVTV